MQKSDKQLIFLIILFVALFGGAFIFVLNDNSKRSKQRENEYPYTVTYDNCDYVRFTYNNTIHKGDCPNIYHSSEKRIDTLALYDEYLEKLVR